MCVSVGKGRCLGVCVCLESNSACVFVQTEKESKKYMCLDVIAHLWEVG